MVINENELCQQLPKTEQIQKIQQLIFEFIDTLLKIKEIPGVLNIYFISHITDIYVVTSEDDVTLSDKIIEKFAQWEATYHIFPELHIINKNEKFYIPNGASEI